MWNGYNLSSSQSVHQDVDQQVISAYGQISPIIRRMHYHCIMNIQRSSSLQDEELLVQNYKKISGIFNYMSIIFLSCTKFTRTDERL